MYNDAFWHLFIDIIWIHFLLFLFLVYTHWLWLYRTSSTIYLPFVYVKVQTSTPEVFLGYHFCIGIFSPGVKWYKVERKHESMQKYQHHSLFPPLWLVSNFPPRFFQLWSLSQRGENGNKSELQYTVWPTRNMSCAPDGQSGPASTGPRTQADNRPVLSEPWPV